MDAHLPYRPSSDGDPVRLLKVPEALKRLGLARSTFYLLVKEGRIPLRKIGGASRIRSDELDAYIRSLPALELPQWGAE